MWRSSRCTGVTRTSWQPPHLEVVYGAVGLLLVRGSQVGLWLAIILPSVGEVLGVWRFVFVQRNPFSVVHVAIDVVVVSMVSTGRSEAMQSIVRAHELWTSTGDRPAWHGRSRWVPAAERHSREPDSSGSTTRSGENTHGRMVEPCLAQRSSR